MQLAGESCSARSGVWVVARGLFHLKSYVVVLFLLHRFQGPPPADGWGNEGIDPTVGLGEPGFTAEMAAVVDSLGL